VYIRSPCPAAVAIPTDIDGVAVSEDFVSFGPKVVPAPRAWPREDWFCEADIVGSRCCCLYMGSEKFIRGKCDCLSCFVILRVMAILISVLRRDVIVASFMVT